MELVIQTCVNVLILASVYILVSLGFAFLFNMLGILNLAHGAVYMVAAYLVYSLIVFLGFNYWVSLIIVTFVIAVLGIFIEKFCLRPFVGDFNRLVTICVAITVILTTTVNILIGTQQKAIPSFADGVLETSLVSVNWDRIVTFIIGTVILVLTTLFVNRTKWGRQMQAISQNMEGAYLQGININRVSAMACALSFAFAAVAGCLMGTLYSLSPFMSQTTLVKVLMIVILAGAGSFAGIFIVGLILGILYAVLPVVLPGATSDAIAAALFMVILLLRPQGFFGHEVEIGEGRQADDLSISGEVGRKRSMGLPLAGLVVLTALLPLFFDSPYTLHVLILVFVYVAVSASLRTIAISGQFPLAHGAFMGIGAYLSGMATRWLGWSPWFAIPLSGLVTGGIAMLFGYPFSRLRSLYYAMGSLFFGVGVIMIISAGGVWTGGYSGLTGVKSLFMGGQTSYYYFFLALCLACLIALYRFEFSRIGINVKAVAQSHLVASSVGINEGGYRILAVGVGSFFAGLVGAAYTHYNLVLSPSSFDMQATLWLVMFVIVGGINSFAGPIVGSIILVALPELFRGLKMYSPYVSSIMLLIVVYLMPGGLVSVPALLRSAILERKKAKRIVNVAQD